MIIGSGLIANALKEYSDRDDVIIFASGVSNSLEKNISMFFREEKLLKDVCLRFKASVIIYFGTCSLYDKTLIYSEYIQHKKRMEQIVTANAFSYIIVRLPQVVGKSRNKTTLTNYLFYSIIENRTFDVWDGAVRYLVDIDDVKKFVSFIVDDIKLCNVIVDLPTTPSKVIDIVRILETISRKKAICNIVQKGEPYSIPLLGYSLSLHHAGIVIDENYVERILHKHYGQQDNL